MIATNHNNNHSNRINLKGTIAQKFRYIRPEFLQLKTDDEISVSADHHIRPIMLPRDGSRLPWRSGYAECINAGKSIRNEDQAACHQNVVINLASSTNNDNTEDGIPWTYFGIFDGHAGADVAVAAASQLHNIIGGKLNQIADLLLAQWMLQFAADIDDDSNNNNNDEDDDDDETESDNFVDCKTQQDASPLRLSPRAKKTVVDDDKRAELTSQIKKQCAINRSRSSSSLEKRATFATPHDYMRNGKSIHSISSEEVVESKPAGFIRGMSFRGPAAMLQSLTGKHMRKQPQQQEEVEQNKQSYQPTTSNNIAGAESELRLPSMIDIFRNNITIDSLITGALEASFWEMDSMIAKDKHDYKMPGGCTAIVSIFILGKLYVCNAGDSRAIVCKSNYVVPMSFDFTPTSERERILRLGLQRPEFLGNEFTHLEFAKRPTRRDLGRQMLYKDAYMTGWSVKTITYDDLKIPLVWGEGKRSRVLATIGVTRGFGDHELRAQYGSVLIKPFLTPEPEVRILSLDDDELTGEDVLIMGSDGLWDVTSNEDASRILKQSFDLFSDFEKYRYITAAQDLVIHSRGHTSDWNNIWRTNSDRMASMDDIAVFVIPLKQYRDEYLEWKRARRELALSIRSKNPTDHDKSSPANGSTSTSTTSNQVEN